MKLLAAIIATAFSLTGCDRISDQQTMRNAAGETVICRPPNAPEFTPSGRLAVAEWCSIACSEHGFRWTREWPEIYGGTSDFDLGKLERIAAEKYLPAQCLPFNPGPMGIVRKSDGGLPDCLGGVLLKCPALR